jgi:hypothetical protein
MRRTAVALAATIALAVSAGGASAAPSGSASCVATITAFEAQLVPGFVGAEVSNLAPVGSLASDLAKAHLGTFVACRSVEG